MSGILVTARYDFLDCLHKEPFTVGKRCLAAVLLKYQQVTAYFDAACLHEQVIRQA